MIADELDNFIASVPPASTPPPPAAPDPGNGEMDDLDHFIASVPPANDSPPATPGTSPRTGATDELDHFIASVPPAPDPGNGEMDDLDHFIASVPPANDSPPATPGTSPRTGATDELDHFIASVPPAGAAPQLQPIGGEAEGLVNDWTQGRGWDVPTPYTHGGTAGGFNSYGVQPGTPPAYQPPAPSRPDYPTYTSTLSDLSGHGVGADRQVAFQIADLIDSHMPGAPIEQRQAEFVRRVQLAGIDPLRLTADEPDAQAAARVQGLIGSERDAGNDPRQTIQSYGGKSPSAFYDELHGLTPRTPPVVRLPNILRQPTPPAAPPLNAYEAAVANDAIEARGNADVADQQWLAQRRAIRQARGDRGPTGTQGEQPPGVGGFVGDLANEFKAYGVQAMQPFQQMRSGAEIALSKLPGPFGPDNPEQARANARADLQWWQDAANRPENQVTNAALQPLTGVPAMAAQAGAMFVSGGTAAPLVMGGLAGAEQIGRTQQALAPDVAAGRMTQDHADKISILEGGARAALTAGTQWLIPQNLPSPYAAATIDRGATGQAIDQAWKMFVGGFSQAQIVGAAMATVEQAGHGAPPPSFGKIIGDSLVAGATVALVHTVSGLKYRYADESAMARAIGLPDDQVSRGMLFKAAKAHELMASGQTPVEDALTALNHSLTPDELGRFQAVMQSWAQGQPSVMAKQAAYAAGDSYVQRQGEASRQPRLRGDVVPQPPPGGWQPFTQANPQGLEIPPVDVGPSGQMAESQARFNNWLRTLGEDPHAPAAYPRPAPSFQPVSMAGAASASTPPDAAAEPIAAGQPVQWQRGDGTIRRGQVRSIQDGQAVVRDEFGTTQVLPARQLAPLSMPSVSGAPSGPTAVDGFGGQTPAGEPSSLTDPLTPRQDARTDGTLTPEQWRELEELAAKHEQPPQAEPSSASTPPTPAAAPRSPALAPVAPRGTFSRGDLQERIRSIYEQQGGGVPLDVHQFAESLPNPWTFLKGGQYAGEVRAMLEEGGREGVAMARRGAIGFTADARQSGGEDAINAFRDKYGDRGEELYWQLARERAGIGWKDALAHAANSPDPELQLLAAIHKNLPDAARRKPQQIIAGQDLPTGSEFMLNGHHMSVVEDADGYRVLRDGNDYPVLPVDELPQIPMDKGTWRKGAEPELPEGDFAPAGDLQFARTAGGGRRGGNPLSRPDPNQGSLFNPTAAATPAAGRGGPLRPRRSQEREQLLARIFTLLKEAQERGNKHMARALEQRASELMTDEEAGVTEGGLATTPAATSASGSNPTRFDADQAGASQPGAGLFGQTTFEPATGSQQGGLPFTTRSAADQIPSSTPIAGSANARNPQHTPPLFPLDRGTPRAAMTAKGASPTSPRSPAPAAKLLTPATAKAAVFGAGARDAMVGPDTLLGRAGEKLASAAAGAASDLAGVRDATAPQTAGAVARNFANALRHMMAELDLLHSRDVAALARASAAMDPMTKEQSIDFTDRYERGQPQTDPKLAEVADALREYNNGLLKEVQDLGTGKLQDAIENYLGRIWRNPGRLKDVIGRLLGKRPLQGSKGFLKRRSYTWFTDAIRAGMEPVTWNPVDMALLKGYEMRRYVLMQKLFAEFRAKGLIQYVAGNAPGPDGWVSPDDNLFKAFGGPTISVQESFDLGVRKQLLALMDELGVEHTRVVSGRGLPAGALGVSFQGDDKIISRFASPDAVIAHELGHALDDRYGLWRALLDAPTGKARQVIREQLRALADLRYAHEDETTEHFKQYVRRRPEQMAAVVQAYVSARDLMRQHAPEVLKQFERFIAGRPELHALRDIQPSLDFGAGTAELAHGGLLIRGKYYVPADAGPLFDSLLRPGLRERSATYRGALAAGNVLNQANLVWNAKHMILTTLHSVASELGMGLTQLASGDVSGGAWALGRAFTGGAPLRDLMLGSSLMKEYYKPGSTNGMIARVLQAYVMAGGHPHQEQIFRNTALHDLSKMWRKAMRPGAAPKVNAALLSMAKAPQLALQLLSGPIQEWYVPRIKAGAAMVLIARDLERLGPGASRDDVREVVRRSYDMVEDRFGQVAYANLFWRRSVKDLAQLLIRSTSWNLGTVRAIAGAAGDAGGNWALEKIQDAAGRFGAGGDNNAGAAGAAAGVRGPTSKGQPWLGDRLAFAGAVAIVTALLAALYQKLATDKWPETLRDYFYPRTGDVDANGHPARLSIPTYLAEGVNWTTHPIKTARGKVHPLVSTVFDMLANKDFYGQQIARPGDTFGQQLLAQASYAMGQAMPFSLQTDERLRDQAAGPGKRVAAALGFQDAPLSQSYTAAEAMAHEILAGKRSEAGMTAKEMAKVRARSEIYRAMRKGREAGGEAARAAVRAHILTPAEAEAAAKHASLPPLVAMLSSGEIDLDAAMRVWDAATPAERAQIRMVILKKLESEANGGTLSQQEIAQHLQRLKPSTPAPAAPASTNRPATRPAAAMAR